MIIKIYDDEKYFYDTFIEINDKNFEDLKNFMREFKKNNSSEDYEDYGDFINRFLDELKQFEWYNREIILENRLSFTYDEKGEYL
jgi:hypothetical protein